MSIEGADFDQMHVVASRLDSAAIRVSELSTNISRMMFQLHWEGGAAEHFRSEWYPRLRVAAEELVGAIRANADELRLEARQQQQASSGDSPGGSMGGQGPSPAGGSVLTVMGPLGWGVLAGVGRSLDLYGGLTAVTHVRGYVSDLASLSAERGTAGQVTKDLIDRLNHGSGYGIVRDANRVPRISERGVMGWAAAYARSKWPSTEGLLADGSKFVRALSVGGKVIGGVGIVVGFISYTSDLSQHHYVDASVDMVSMIGGVLMMGGGPLAVVGGAMVVGSLIYQYRGAIGGAIEGVARDEVAGAKAVLHGVEGATKSAENFGKKVLSWL